MTVTTNTNKVQALGNGATTNFPYAFRIYAATDLIVTVTDLATGVDSVKVLNTDYTVTGAGSYNGGNVVFSVAPASNARVTIRREVSLTQGTDLRNQGAYYAETHEDVFDRLTMIDQQQQEALARSLTLAPTASGVSTSLPNASASTVIGWNDTGTALKNYGPVDNTLLAVDLADSVTLTKGVAMIGGAGRVVSSIVALRALPKDGSKNACVTDYYAAGDGGGGFYYYDAADTTSADNGGTIIVATDGGRWKLTHNGEVSVKQFGAKGDGVTDDTAAFAAAHKHVQTTGGTIYVPSGTYIVGMTADWANGSASGWLDTADRTYSVSFRIYGDGPSSVIKAKSGTGHAIYYNTPIGAAVPSDRVHTRWITVEDLAFDCNAEPYGLKIANAGAIRVRNCSGYNNTATAASSANVDTSGCVYIQGAGLFRFENLNLNPNPSACGINVNDGAGDGSISLCDIATGYIGILFKDSTGNTRVYDNTVYNQGGYCLLTKGNVNDNNQLKIWGNQFAEAGIALVSINENSTKAAVALNFHDNTMWVNTVDGIRVGRADKFRIANNQFPWATSGIAFGYFAIRIAAPALRGTIAGNDIDQIKAGGTGIYYSGSSDMTIMSNRVFDIANDATAVFIHIDASSGSLDRSNVKYNEFMATGVPNAFNIKITGTPIGLRLQDNHRYSGQDTAFGDAYRAELKPSGVYNSSGFTLQNSAWNFNPLRMGSYYLWWDGSGKFRYKNGAPASDGDGFILGMQT